ncbi:MAG TPA: thiamine pyrophosphate-dependent enzyme, partial [Candidatus Kapabacteria bacterium]|nr:thiamine pyrophosphate-dependent enzyme [Candidatus Kapabacteria bacterium]
MATKSTKKPAASQTSSNGNNGNSHGNGNGTDAKVLNGQSPVATNGGMTDAPKSGTEKKFEQMEEEAIDMQELISMPVTPSSMEQMPNGAKLTGPTKDGSRSFRGTLEQAGVDKETLLAWYKEMDLGRIADTQAANYLKKAMGWSYHAPCAGHEGIQLAIGKSFRKKQDYLFPYYRDLMTCLSAGLTVEEIIWNGLSKDTDIAGGGRHMSNHFAKQEFNIQNVSSLTNNHAQHVAGTARALKYYQKDAVAIFSAGESGTSE